MATKQNLHQGLLLRHAGVPLTEAAVALILLHGRGGSAQDMLDLGHELDAPGVVLLAPQAANATWYPNRFVAPVASNEPWLTSALAVVEEVVQRVVQAGIPLHKTILLGFSQGGCLALEYVARTTQRYGAVVGLSAALIENGDQPRTYTGTLESVPVFLGCSDVDAHIPIARVDRSATIFAGLGATVDKRIYPGMGHTVNRDELQAIQDLLTQIAGAPQRNHL